MRYDTEETPKAASPHSLRVYLSHFLEIPLDKLMIAKHKMEAFEWIVIEDSSQVLYSYDVIGE